MGNPLMFALCGAALLAAACWVLSLVFREYSWVDRVWSIAPPLHALWLCHATGTSPRPTLMVVLITLWGVRLTYNFARKGGYAKGGEDYRWAVMRSKMGPITWQLFNVVFICAVQQALLLALVLPVWVAAQHEPSPLGPLDMVLTGAFLLLLLGETLADQQQWRFQCAKRARIARGQPEGPRFVTTGLFACCRHPNFFCELAMWWTIYAFSVAAGAPWINASVVGAIGLTLVFMGSTPLTERITLSKYPEYADYQRSTSRLLPWLPKR
jgi:steroid 5-alpha reductase family enzyme